MTQVARVFVFLNLVLAAAFLMASAVFLGLNNDWKKAHAEKVKELETAQSAAARDKADLSAEISRLQQSNAALDREKTQFETDARNKGGEIQQLNSQLAEKDTQIRTLNANTTSMLNEVTALRTDKNALVEKAEAEAAKARDAVAKSMEAIAAKEEADKTAESLRMTINDLEVANTGLGSKLADAENLIAYARDKGFGFDGIAAPSPVEGRVLNYDRSINLVQVNKGQNDGVQRGYYLDITSGDRYLGRMVVEGVTANTAHGTLRVTVPGVSSIPVGARATNRLN